MCLLQTSKQRSAVVGSIILLIVLAAKIAPCEAQAGVQASQVKPSFVPATAKAEKVNSRFGRATTYWTDRESSFETDNATGLLVSYINLNPEEVPIKPDDAVRVTEDEAIKIASRFLQEKRLSLSPLWTVSSVKLYDNGGLGKNYSIYWYAHYSGVKLPALCWIEVNATYGKVTSYVLREDPVAVPLIWKVSAEDAIAAVVRAKNLKKWDVDTVELRVWYRRTPDADKFNLSDQVLMWYVYLQDPDGQGPVRNYVRANVDANTGEIIGYEYWGGMPLKLTAAQKAAGKKKLAQQPKPNPSRSLSAPPTVFQQAQKASRTAKP